MTDKEKFQKTFERLHASPEIITEVINMTENNKIVSIRKKHRIPKTAVAAIALVLILGIGRTAYAMDLGGIQRIVQVWIYGDQTDVVFTLENGTYTLDYTDDDGNAVQRGGGGVAFNADGTQRPLSEEEILAEINSPEVEYEEDGTVWIYYLNQKLEITDKFEDDFCYVELSGNGETIYMTIKYHGGYSVSPHGYAQPWTFDVGEE